MVTLSYIIPLVTMVTIVAMVAMLDHEKGYVDDDEKMRRKRNIISFKLCENKILNKLQI